MNCLVVKYGGSVLSKSKFELIESTTIVVEVKFYRNSFKISINPQIVLRSYHQGFNLKS